MNSSIYVSYIRVHNYHSKLNQWRKQCGTRVTSCVYSIKTHVMARPRHSNYSHKPIRAFSARSCHRWCMGISTKRRTTVQPPIARDGDVNLSCVCTAPENVSLHLQRGCTCAMRPGCSGGEWVRDGRRQKRNPIYSLFIDDLRSRLIYAVDVIDSRAIYTTITPI